MAYYSKYTDRMDIHIEEGRGTILIKQKWKYFWLNAMNTSMWSHSEKQKFHKEVDNLIWNNWGEYFFLKAQGTSNFAKRHSKTRWDVNFDIEWVTHTEHWKVNIKKNSQNVFMKSNVKWFSREINLDTLDTSFQKRIVNNADYFQYPVVHEFGHSVGNSIAVGHGDEYNSINYSNDYNSLMNVGKELRDRHLDYIIYQLNTMIPSTNFSIY